MNKKRNDEIIDLVKSYPKYGFYKKKFEWGNNFDYKLVITPETRGSEHPQMHYRGICQWWELEGRFKVSKADMVKLIEKKSIIHRWKDPDTDTKVYEGKIKFVDREPTIKERNKIIAEQKKSNKKFWLIVGIIILVLVVYFNK